MHPHAPLGYVASTWLPICIELHLKHCVGENGNQLFFVYHHLGRSIHSRATHARIKRNTDQQKKEQTVCFGSLIRNVRKASTLLRCLQLTWSQLSHGKQAGKRLRGRNTNFGWNSRCPARHLLGSIAIHFHAQWKGSLLITL